VAFERQRLFDLGAPHGDDGSGRTLVTAAALEGDVVLVDDVGCQIGQEPVDDVVPYS
jgi:hypothetical protein